MAAEFYSIVQYYGEEKCRSCGYCSSPNTNFSHAMWAHILNVKDYQALIDRGWRRSGSYCYKPTMNKTCCPMYTIKCEALNFKVSKSQKKVLKRMARFLKNEQHKDDVMDTHEDQDRIGIEEISNYNKYCQKARQSASEMKVKSVDKSVNAKLQPDALDKEKRDCDSKSQQKPVVNIPSVKNNTGESSVKSVEMNSAKPPCKKAKLLRKERKQNKLLAQGKSQEEIDAIFKEHKQQNHAKSLEELMDESLGGTNRLEIKLVRVFTDEFFRTFDESLNVYKKYQMAIHGNSPEKCDKQSFTNFLVENPLKPYNPDDGPPHGYGAFHDQYWLDNELIAVGVIDILPYCISSVYFFYNPAYSYLSLGTLSSLREVYLTRQCNKVAKDLKYYYMGFYIHSCPKMRYKARIKPSKLLCPETYAWFDIEPCLLKLEKEKYSRLNDDIDAIDEDGVVDIRKVLVLYHQVLLPYDVYEEQAWADVTKDEENEVKEYASLVGMKCAQSMLLYRR